MANSQAYPQKSSDKKSSSSSKSKSSSSTSSKSKSKESDKKGSVSRHKAKTTLRDDKASGKLSNRTGIDGFVHESAWDAPWSAVGAGRSG